VYFPNKSALLQPALKRHLVEVADAVELVCKEQKGKTLRQMVTALITTFLDARRRDARTSVARSLLRHLRRGRNEDRAANENPVQPLTTDPQLVASMLQGAEDAADERSREAIRHLAPGTDRYGVRLPGCLFCGSFGSECRGFELRYGNRLSSHAHHAMMLPIASAARTKARLICPLHRERRGDDWKAENGQQQDGKQSTQSTY